MTKLTEDDRKWRIETTLYRWLEDAALGRMTDLRASADEIAEIVLALGFDPQPIRAAAKVFDRGIGYAEMRVASDLIVHVLEDAVDVPWQPEDATPPTSQYPSDHFERHVWR